MSGPSSTRTIRLLNVDQGLEEPEAELRLRSARLVGLDPDELRGFRIARRSLDARRRRGQLRFVCHVELVVEEGQRNRALQRLMDQGRAQDAPLPASLLVEGTPRARRAARAVVVGAGPAGLFAALVLARNGVAVDLIERGARLDGRGRKLAAFHRGGVLDPDTNLLYGEGGAGTYSDGKLYTRVDDALEVPLLEELVACGAPREILYDSRAHIGTDRLHRILPRLRAGLEADGVRFHFDVRLEELRCEPGPPQRVTGLVTSAGELGCDVLFLALGHSARDTWLRLAEQGVAFEPKPFQFGVRIEHPQELITRGRYGEGREAQLLGPASYSLIAKPGEAQLGVHSFCMCPGGKIVGSVNEEGLLCTNGMSNSTHSSPFANAALVTTVTPADFLEFGGGPFAGVHYQRHFEQRFFEAGGANYAAPAQRVPDFLAGRESEGELRTSYSFGAVPGRVDTLLPPAGREALRRALLRFERMLPGFAGPEGLLVGVESRSSGPVRCPRARDTRRAAGWSGLYPVGEGAGYAGGIMSAAVDGARSAQAWLAQG